MGCLVPTAASHAHVQIATQIALAHPKCKVVTIAGGPEKCAKLKELGAHVSLDYKSPNFAKEFRKVGLVDVYFDNGLSRATLNSWKLPLTTSRRRDPRPASDQDEALWPYHRLRCHIRI